MEQVVSGVAVVVAFIAAGLWLKASSITVKRGSPLSKGGFFNGDLDIVSTAMEQSWWNKYAAVLTAISTLLQGIAVLIHAQSNTVH